MKLDQNITTQELMQLDYRYRYSDAEMHLDWEALRKCKQYKTGSQFKPGMKLCQHFHPNFWDIQNAKGVSFSKLWQDPEIMDSVRLWGLKSMSQLWISWIRRAVFMRGGIANSSFYRPHFSKQVIEMTGIKNGLLFDPCAGWGGRMLGTCAANWKYISCEPNVQTYENNLDIAKFLDIQDSITIHNMPVEDFNIESISPDVVLTSPPYFNLEVYTDDTNQSYNKFNEYKAWESQWLIPLIERSLRVLNPNGISAWNVMNFGKNDLVSAVISTHESLGWELVDTVGFNSPLSNMRKLKNKDVTYIFRMKGK